ncbi:Hemolysin, chromosomal [Anatilimnocola aggregata]|uniref:Hemolysin, chromosomal n=1 Tax=Anatilimnocola aggregata TaxID=2528021 RepID=A0A517YMB2_9BACT|nr:autotransporter-associated beta strand repeat-containing protein [Anatilimnocola aggregata]QDU31369.1 Hemolysin, chromosomal [Anatilimnocola aggregata]
MLNRTARSLWSRFLGKQQQAKALKRRRRSFLEALEDRSLMAVYTWFEVANTLAISLENDEALTISEATGTVSFVVAGGTGVFTQTGGDTAVGSGTNTIAIPTADLAASLAIDNSLTTAGANSVTFSGVGLITSAGINVALSDPDATGNINVNSPLTASAGAISLSGVNVSGTGAIITTAGLNVTNTDLTSTLSGVIAGAGGLTKSGSGTLVVSGNNTHNGGTTVSAGTLNLQTTFNGTVNTNPIGTGTLTNNGATVIVSPATEFSAPRGPNGNLAMSWFDAGAGTALITNIGNNTATGGLLGTTPAGTNVRSGTINFGNDAAFTGATASPGSGYAMSNTDNYMFLFRGYFTPSATGDYQFGVGNQVGTTNIDDEAAIYLDRDQNGRFLTSGTASLNERVAYRATSGGSDAGAAITLTAGVAYPIAIASREGGVGSVLIANIRRTTGTAVAWANINPATVSGPTTVGSFAAYANAAGSAFAPNNPVSVSGTATFELQVGGVSFGELAASANSTLNINGTQAGTNSTATFASANFADAVTINTNTANSRIVGVVAQTTAGDLIKGGANLLTFNGNNTYAGNTLVNTGILAISGNNALGAVAGSTTVASGAQLQLQGSVGYSSLEGLSLNGTGVGSTGALRNRAGTSSFAGPISLAGNAEVQSDSGTLTLSGGIGIGTNFITFDTANANGNNGPITVNTNPITGTTGGITARGSNNSPVLTLSTANTYSGSTTITGGGRILASNSGAFGTSAVTVDNTANNQLRVGPNLNIPNTLNIQGGGISGQGVLHFANGAAATTTWSGDISISGNAVAGGNHLGSDAGDRVLNLTGPITSTASNGVGVRLGTVQFSNATTSFTPATLRIDQGEARLGVADAFPASASILIANVSGATFNLNGFNQTINNVVMPATYGAGTSGNALITNSGAAAATLTIGNNDASTNFAGRVTNGANALTIAKVGTGTVTLHGNNTYSGGTTISAGSFVATAPGALGTGTVTENGGTLSVSPAVSSLSGFGTNGAGWTLNGAATVATNVLTISSAANQARSAYFNQRVATSKFTVNFTYNNPNTTPTGSDGFTFVMHNDPRGVGALGGSGGSFGYAGITPSVALGFDIWEGRPRGAKLITNGVVGLNYTLPGGSPAPVLVGNGTPISVSLSYDGTSLSATLTQGANTFTLPALAINIPVAVGPTSFIGFTSGTGGETSTQTISNFTYAYTDTAANLPATYVNAVNVPAGVTGNTVVVGNSFASNVTLGGLNLGDGATLNVTTSGTPAGQAYGLTLGAAAVNTAATVIVANNGAGVGTLQLGGLNDSGIPTTLVKQGLGDLVLSSPATSLVSGTAVDIEAGTLHSNNATALGAFADFEIDGGAFFHVGASQTIGALAGAGSATLNGNTLSIGNTNDLSGNFSGSISDGSSAGSLVKQGAGTLTLSGSNSYTGSTTVSNGTLLVNGSTDAASAVTVAGGATLGGNNGTVGGSVDAAETGVSTIAPAANGVGKLMLGSTITFDSDAVFVVDINGSGIAGTDYDQLVVNGVATLANAPLVLNTTAAPTTGSTLTILDATSITGRFTHNGRVLEEGDTFHEDGVNYTISYVGGDVTLTEAGATPGINGTANGDDFLVIQVGGNLEVSLNGVVVYSALLANVDSITLNGQGDDDSAIIDYAGGVFAELVNFNGGTQATVTGDDLLLQGGTFDLLEYKVTGVGAGKITLSGAGGTGTVNFTGLEPVVVTSPAGSVTLDIDNDVVDGFASAINTIITDAGGGMMLADFDVGAEDLNFVTPTVALNILGDITGDDGVTITSVPTGFAAAVSIDGQGGADSISINAALTLGGGVGPSTGAVSLAAQTIDINQAINSVAGGATGTIALSGSTISTSSNLSTDGSAITIAAATAFVLDGATVTIDTESGNNSNAGAVNFTGTTLIRADVAGRDLVINANVTAGAFNGGAVTLKQLGGTGGAFLNDVTINTNGSGAGTAGLLILDGNVTLSNGGDTAAFTYSGTKVAIASTLTIDTENGTAAPGEVNLGLANIYATAANVLLTINTNVASGTGGFIAHGLVDDNGGADYFLAGLTEVAQGSTSGELRLSQSIFVEGNISLSGRGRPTASITIDSHQADGVGGSISLINNWSSNVAGVDLTLDSSATTTGGNISIPALTNLLGQYFNDVSLNSDGGTSDGSITLTANISLDLAAGDAGDFVVANSNTTSLATIVISPAAASGGATLTIDTEQGNNGNGGNVNLGTAANTRITSVDVDTASGATKGADLAITTGTTMAFAAGAITLPAVLDTDGAGIANFTINDLSLNTDGTTTDGTITLTGDISLDNGNTTNDAASFSVTGGGNIILGVVAASTLTIDTESGSTANVTDVGGVNFGTSAVSATNANVNLAIDTSNTGSTSVGGNVTLAGFNSAGGNLVNDLTITADASGTRGDVSFTTAAVNLAGGLNVAIADEISQSAAAPITTVSSVSMTARNTVSLNANVNAGASTISISANQDGAGSEGFTQASGTSIVTTNATATALVVRVNTAAGGTGGAALGLLEVGAAPGQITVNTTSTAGSGGAIIDNNAGVLNLSGGDAALLASGGIGSADAIEMNLTNVGFNNSTAGDVRLTELVGTGGFVVNAVVGVATSANTGGAAFLIASSPITFAVNTSATNITAQALESAATNTDNITVNSGVTVTATTGNVLFEAGDRIVIQSTGLVTATLGNVTFDSGFSDTDNDGLMDLSGGVSAVAGTVTLDLNAEAGPTSNATQTATSTITSVTLSLLTTGGGTGVFDLDAPTTNNVSNLIANVGGEVEYRDANSLTLGTGGNGITTSNDDATICVIAGNLTLSDNVNLGSGTLRLQTDAVGSGISQSAGTITASALGLRSGTGGINLPTATNDVDTLAGTTTGSFTFQDADGFTIGTVGIDGCFTPGVTGITSGDLELCVLTGDITISDNIAAGGNSVRLQATAGNVVETLAATITAGTLGVRAGGGNVTLDNSNDVDNLAAFASGNVSVVNVGGVIIGTVGAGPCFTATTGVSTTAGTISVINNTSGNITISQAVSAGGANSVTLDANGATADLLVNASVNSAGGAISLTADNDVSFNATGDVASNNGAITITGDAGVPVGGAVTMDPDTAIDSGTGTIHVSATGNITLGDLTTTNATLLAVTITSTAGGVVDAGADVDTEITANAAGSRVTIIAATGIGATNAIETEVASLDASVTAAGNILIVEVSSIDLFDIDTAAGSITIQSGGTMTATDVQSNTDSDTNDITLTTTAGGIGVGTIAAGVAGDVFLTAATAITDLDATNPDITADDLVLLSTTGVGTLADPLETVSSNLEAVGGTGGVFIANSGDLTVGGIDALVIGVSATGTGIAISTIGNLDVSEDVIASGAAADVMLSTVDQLALTQNLTVNSGVTVQSTGGSVTLNAGDALEVQAGGSASAGTFLTLNVDLGGADPLNGATVDLFGSLTANNGDVTLTTGSEADAVTLTGTITANAAGDITISLGAGTDQFNAATTATAVLTASLNTITINGGNGNDTILLGDQFFAATISAASTILNGNNGTNNPDGSDTFKVRASTTTPFTIDGDDPTEPTLPGDTLFVDLTGVSGPVNESHGDPNTTISFPNPPNSQLDITYREIETRQTTGLGSPLVNHIFDLLNYPLVPDGVFDVQLTSDSNLKVTLNGASVYNGDDSTVNSLTFAGNAGNDAVRIHALAGTGELPSEGGLVDFGLDGVNTLPGVTPTGISSMDATRKAVSGAFAANARTPVSLSNNRAGVYFDGRGGTNSIVLDVTTARDVAYLSDSQAGFGANQGDLSVQAAGGTLRGFAASFANVNSVHLREQTAVGSKLLIDASSTSATTTISVVDILDPVTTSQYDALNPVNNSLVVNPNVTFTGASQLVGNGGVAATRFANFADVTIRSGGYTGASVGETLDLISLDPLGLTTLALDAGSALGTGAGPGADSGAADTIQLRSLPSGVTATLTGGLGSDTFRLHGETTIVVDNDPPTDYTNVPGSDGLDANDTVDNIAGPVVVDGEDANLANNNDQLFIIDSGDTTADPNVLIAAAGGMNADYAVTGINASGVTFRNIDSFDYTGTQGGDTIDGRFTPTNVPHDLNTVALRGFDGDDQFLLFTSNQWGGVTPVTELPFTRVASGVGTISLYGNDGEDIFGETPAPVIGNTGAMHVGLAVPATTRLIRPTTAATAGGSTIFIDGGDPVPALNQAGDTVGDVLNLDVTDVPKNTAMIVGAGSSGNVLSANTAPFSWVSIEDLNLVDNGKLTGVQIGDVFGRGTTGNDLMQISANATAALPHQVRVRIGGAIMNYNVPGKAVLYGGNGVDTMSQTTAKIPAVFYGEAGNDSLAGGSNNDWLVGGDGNDQITGGEGQNVIWGDNAPTNPGDPTPQDFQGPNDGNDSISSGNGADVIYAGGGHDVVNSGGGNDYIHAGAGNDSVDAGAGDDRVYGYSGNDTLQGNSGNDLLSGGDGNDWLLGHSGNNVLIGGTGSDTLSGGDGNDLLITGGLGGEENSTWTSAPNTMTYAANTYSDPMDNDAALLALLTAWQGNSNAAAPPPEVLALLPIIAPDGSDDDAWGGNGSDLFSWDAADMADESLTAPGPNDFNNPATGPDVRLINP